MERQQIENLVREIHAARVRGDTDAMLANFSDQAVFRIVGAAHASPIAGQTVGVEELRKQLDTLVGAFEFQDQQIVSLLMDGPRIGVHSRVTVRAVASGETATTEVFDLIEFQDGRIASFTQFADTALAARLAS